MMVKEYWIWLTQLKGIGPILQKKLLDKFGSPESIYLASGTELMTIAGINNKTVEKIQASKSLEQARRILDRTEKQNIRLLTYHDSLYPVQVKDFSKAPVLFYYRGNLWPNSTGVGIVGARRCTDYGKQVTKEAATFLAKQDIPVISGMAKGIDSYAHTACLKAGGFTIAILGCGVDVCYPAEHRGLMDRIAEEGVLLSEYPPQTRVRAEHFPQRNTWIAAWSNKLLIVEAGEKSGALITAQLAEKQNRQVLAVPGQIYSQESTGCNQLIHKGAKIYLHPNQLLLDSGQKKHERRINSNEAHRNKRVNEIPPLSQIEKEIYDHLSPIPQSVEQLAGILGSNPSALLRILCAMELEGKIELLAGGMVRRH
ncbi:DNA protecting protein DprA [Desulfofarcimen acetoxidans DSM 771]|uniref:DNA protecting protein DprA n=2 Tax=Desulfofarcimen acetoxidans TaxID=58138 RepID=C8VYM8_DESAS|nr:DNA protecting protein DprA [Desulfofarcimen acetoxidans DSM 771]